jgi:hypothetical protein
MNPRDFNNFLILTFDISREEEFRFTQNNILKLNDHNSRKNWIALN